MGIYIVLLGIALIAGLILAFCVYASIIIYYQVHRQELPSPLGYIGSFMIMISAFLFPFVMLGVATLAHVH